MHTAVKTRKSSEFKYRNSLTSNFPMFVKLQINVWTIYMMHEFRRLCLKLFNLFPAIGLPYTCYLRLSHDHRLRSTHENKLT